MTTTTAPLADAIDAKHVTHAAARRARIERSPQWRDGRFRNTLPRVDGPILRMLREFFFGGSKFRRPAVDVPFVHLTAADFAAPPATGLGVTWLGHSTAILEIDGRRVLVDPVWGERAGPVSFAGPRRFFPPPLPLAELPPVDIVLLSHDHYDHLHEGTVRALAERGVRWVTALGVGTHLERWGVRPVDVVELDWWESLALGDVTITATPARHFSGRTVGRSDRTLWAGWALVGPRHRVFYSGDTAMHDDFATIGARLGPFDLTMIEVGAYDALWADVHLGPEQAVEAHRLVRGAAMLPMHWGLFDLALHGWTEPIERVLASASAAGVRVLTPRPGERVEPATAAPPTRWWPAVPWHTAREAPIRSTGVAASGPVLAAQA
ncbi:MAG: MBL fold metallo-hydrolase [Gemmatirosa sp.]|nr:MBL fold metallo-hydrolase [Gemmatirosa sp.]